MSFAIEYLEAGCAVIYNVHSSFVAHISSAGLRAFHTLFNKLRAIHPDDNLSEADVMQGIKAGTYRSPHLKLLNVSTEIQGMLKMSGFDMYLESFTDKKQAIASF